MLGLYVSVRLILGHLRRSGAGIAAEARGSDRPGLQRPPSRFGNPGSARADRPRRHGSPRSRTGPSVHPFRIRAPRARRYAARRRPGRFPSAGARRCPRAHPACPRSVPTRCTRVLQGAVGAGAAHQQPRPTLSVQIAPVTLDDARFGEGRSFASFAVRLGVPADDFEAGNDFHGGTLADTTDARASARILPRASVNGGYGRRSSPSKRAARKPPAGKDEDRAVRVAGRAESLRLRARARCVAGILRISRRRRPVCPEGRRVVDEGIGNHCFGLQPRDGPSMTQPSCSATGRSASSKREGGARCAGRGTGMRPDSLPAGARQAASEAVSVAAFVVDRVRVPHGRARALREEDGRVVRRTKSVSSRGRSIRRRGVRARVEERPYPSVQVFGRDASRARPSVACGGRPATAVLPREREGGRRGSSSGIRPKDLSDDEAWARRIASPFAS